MSDKPNFTQLMKMAKDMQKNMEKMQQDMANKIVTATVGTGDTTVTAKINGLQLVTEIVTSAGAEQIDSKARNELIASAVNKALEEVREVTKGAMLDLYQQSGLDLEDGNK